MRLGETYVHGKDPRTATGLLAAAERLHLPPDVVRTNDSGFVVPDPVWDEFDNPPDVEPF